jgi:hypothetical protein
MCVARGERRRQSRCVGRVLAGSDGKVEAWMMGGKEKELAWTAVGGSEEYALHRLWPKGCLQRIFRGALSIGGGS